MKFANVSTHLNPREPRESREEEDPEELDELVELVEYNDEGLSTGAIIGIAFACLIGLYVVYRLYSWWTRGPPTTEDLARQQIKIISTSDPDKLADMMAEKNYKFYANQLGVDSDTYTNILKEVAGGEFEAATELANQYTSLRSRVATRQRENFDMSLRDMYTRY